MGSRRPRHLIQGFTGLVAGLWALVMSQNHKHSQTYHWDPPVCVEPVSTPCPRTRPVSAGCRPPVDQKLGVRRPAPAGALGASGPRQRLEDVSAPLSPCAVSPCPFPCRGAMQPTDTLSLQRPQQPTATGMAGTAGPWGPGQGGWAQQTGRLPHGPGLGPGGTGSGLGRRGACLSPLSPRAPYFFSQLPTGMAGGGREPQPQFSSPLTPSPGGLTPPPSAGGAPAPDFP